MVVSKAFLKQRKVIHNTILQVIKENDRVTQKKVVDILAGKVPANIVKRNIRLLKETGIIRDRPNLNDMRSCYIVLAGGEFA